MSRKPDPSSSKTQQNEYIPTFISKKPFYLESADSETDYLEHQRLQSSSTPTDPASTKWYDRGKRAGPAATKFRKGACENCGAMTHKAKDCLSRPRAKGAKWTGKDIQADEVVQDVKLGWDAKRDRWNGYDASEYRQVVEEFEELERMKNGPPSPGDGEGEGVTSATSPPPGVAAAENGDAAKYTEESDMGRQQPTSTRNLRLREDTAKYLLNLDLESAKYDPKTRSMVDSGALLNDSAAALIAEDNFMRSSGDAAEFEKAQKYAWEAQENSGNGNSRGIEKPKIHLQANPTSGEYIRKKEKEESERRKAERRKLLMAKYGGDENALPSTNTNSSSSPSSSTKRQNNPAAMVIESSNYVEYDENALVKRPPGHSSASHLAPDAKSKYAEDIHMNNHTSVWGSWWHDFRWGYSCCHSTVKNSYCTGDDGIRAFEEAEGLRLGQDMDVLVPTQAASTATKEEKEGLAEEAEEDKDEDRRKRRKLNETTTRTTSMKMKGAGVTEEEMEKYQRSRAVADDPMAKFLGKDELVH